MRSAWLLGWAGPKEWVGVMVCESFPADQHMFYTPGATSLARLAVEGPFDLTVGYSLGALLLLSQAKTGVCFSGRVALLAPFFAFCCERNLGGRVAEAQLLYLARWVKRAPQAALADFYTRAELLDLGGGSTYALDLDELDWGLKRLAEECVSPPMPEGWLAWCGAKDPFVDAERLKALMPGLRVLPEGNHHPRGLIGALAQEIGS